MWSACFRREYQYTELSPKGCYWSDHRVGLANTIVLTCLHMHEHGWKIDGLQFRTFG
jgi:hypothetical protein